MNHYLDAKLKHKNLYRFFTVEGDEITYRLLTWNEYIAYTQALESTIVPGAIIEEQIFRDCVIDNMYTDGIDNLLAGDVLTLVSVILMQSGPQSAEEIDDKLEEKRQTVYSLSGQVISLICQAFPGYTPDQINTMDWDRIMDLLALAESMLISQGVLKEPLQISGKAKIKTGINNISDIDDTRPPPGDWNLHRKQEM